MTISPPKHCNTCESSSKSSHVPEDATHNIRDSVLTDDGHGTVVPPPILRHDDSNITDHQDDNHIMNPPYSSDVRARMSLALEEHLHNRPEFINSHYENTLSLDRSSPKPCIVPGNALQLIDEDPAAPRSHTPSSIIIVGNDGTTTVHGRHHDSQSATTPDTSSIEHGQDGEIDDPNRKPRVRFRSRVRITSGLRRHRHSHSGNGGAGTGNGNNSGTPSSSASGSPSSSISAPLRWQADENGAWGPLGRRLSAYAHSNGWQRPGARLKEDRGRGSVANGVGYPKSPRLGARMDERTPLIRGQGGRRRSRVSYVDTTGSLDISSDADDEGSRLIEDEDEVGEDDERAMRTAALRREEEAVFGKWPWRIFNRHWWWWHMEPVLCCCCSDDSDIED
ncbi:hypothetical protein ABKN59_009345 [Abortiporus biennis]